MTEDLQGYECRYFWGIEPEIDFAAAIKAYKSSYVVVSPEDPIEFYPPTKENRI